MTANAPGQVCLMQGNEAIVRGALEAGINFAASYPGSPSSQVLGMLGKVARERNFYAEWSTNETCAMEACIGASLANARSLCIVKQNGLLCTAGRSASRCTATARWPGRHRYRPPWRRSRWWTTPRRNSALSRPCPAFPAPETTGNRDRKPRS